MKLKSVWAFLTLILFVVGSYGLYLIIGMPIDQTDNLNTNTEIDISDLGISEDEALIFYSSSCPHCKTVAEYLNQNADNIKIPVRSLKIDDSKTDGDNIKLALAKVKECEVGENWGIPLMYHDGGCLMGDQPIIEYLSHLK